MAKIPRVTDQQIIDSVEAEMSSCPTEDEIFKTKAADIFQRIAEEARRGRGEFPNEVRLSDLGRSLFLLCRRSREEGDPLLLLLAGWREAEEKQYAEHIRLMY